jgi:ketosteroid isomerase-like protein
MKRLMFSIVLVLLVSCLCFGQAKQAAVHNAVQEITALENAWNEASQKYNVSWFEKYLADSYVGTDEEGKVSDKAMVTERVKNKVAKIEAVSNENVKVQLYGDTAIATGIFVVKGTFKEKDNSGKYPWTDTWIKLNGRWQCVASHNSKLPSVKK